MRPTCEKRKMTITAVVRHGPKQCIASNTNYFLCLQTQVVQLRLTRRAHPTVLSRPTTEPLQVIDLRPLEDERL